uniref:Pentatricopeptide repeat-containing protein n=1 Tax=Rhizophora mucronata TaxID=61149 RepID=A0A2P2MX17_RHIMU
MPVRDVVAWNSMLTGYSQLCLQREALSFFQQMRASNTRPDHFTFTATLSLCAGAGLLWDGAKLHAQVVVSGYHSSLPVNNSLIDMYGKCWRPFCAGKVFEDMSEANDVSWCSLLFAYTNCGQFDVASEVFSLMPRKIDVAWNTMISGLGRCGQIERCLDLFKEMRNSLCEPDQWTYSALMNACTESLEFFYGCMVHAIVTKSGWICAVEASNSLLSFYAKFGSIIDATNVFKSTGMQSQFSWNAIIDAYMQVGEIHEAFITFQNMPEKNVVSWTSMIAGYTRHGYGEEALGFFIGMMRNCLLPDECAFGAVLHTCSNLAVLGHGRMFHGCIIHYGFHAYAYVGNGLVNMYAKCGDIDRSILAFNDIFEKDLVSFNAMLFAFGLHGKAKQALQLYEDMVASGTDPDKVTFVGLLMTCSHSGLVEKGRAFFESMSSIYGLSYETDHVACMVDMLGRSGFLAEAKELAIKYCKADEVQASSCEALLGACYSHGELRIGNYLGEALNVLQPYKETSYVLRSNLYCTSGQWKEAEMLRKAMVDEGLKKMPGCSWIEVNNKVTAFVAGNHSHPTMEDLCRILHFLDSGISYSSFCHFEN